MVFEIWNKQSESSNKFGLNEVFLFCLFQYDFSNHVNSEENGGNLGILIHHPLIPVQLCLKQLSEWHLDMFYWHQEGHQ